MPVTPEDFVVYLSLLSEEMNLRVVVPQNIKGGLITGTSATIGGLCGGPVGLLFGGAFGGTVAAVSCKDKCEEVKDLMVKLDRQKRLQIYNAFESLLEEEFRARNFTEFNARIERNLDLKHDILKELKSFILKTWRLQLYDPRVKSDNR